VINYLFNILIALDFLANALLGGEPQETISERLWREYPSSECRKLVDFIFGKDHCKQSAEDK
jgi:hypothetical protein